MHRHPQLVAGPVAALILDLYVGHLEFGKDPLITPSKVLRCIFYGFNDDKIFKSLENITKILN